MDKKEKNVIFLFYFCHAVKSMKCAVISTTLLYYGKHSLQLWFPTTTPGTRSAQGAFIKCLPKKQSLNLGESPCKQSE